MDRLLITVDAAADALSLSRSTVYELMAEGKLQSLTVGKARRISAESLRRFIAEQESAAARSAA